MAESLESHVRHLRSKLQSLQLLYGEDDRPPMVDLEIQVIQEQLRNLVGSIQTDGPVH